MPSDSENAQAPSYPPDVHIVRDLAPVVLRSDAGSVIELPVIPELLDATGRLRIGAAATVIDIIAGETAIREVLPQWVATGNLSLQVRDLPRDGTFRAKPRVLRQGRTNLVMELHLDHVETGDPLGLSTISFSILPNRNANQARVEWAEKPQPRTEFGGPGVGLKQPLHGALGIEFDPSRPGEARLAVSPYVINTLGAMQGGVVAMLIDAAADHFAAHHFGGTSQLRGMEIHYLKLARVGPVRADVRLLSETNAGLILRVSLHDEGANDVLLTVATVMADPAAI